MPDQKVLLKDPNGFVIWEREITPGPICEFNVRFSVIDRAYVVVLVEDGIEVHYEKCGPGMCPVGLKAPLSFFGVAVAFLNVVSDHADLIPGPPPPEPTWRDRPPLL